MRRWFFIAVAAGGCFSPDLRDGTIACGDQGCPPGMTCADDGLCYANAPLPRAVFATASAVGNDRLYAYCSGSIRAIDLEVGPSAAIAWGDADSDGIPELAVAGVDGTVTLYRVGGHGLEAMGAYMLPAPAVDLAWGDFDGDGRLDLATAGPDAMHVLAWYGDHLDSWWDSNPHVATAISSADTDGDGIDEIALATTGESVIVYGPDGQGGLDRVFSGNVGDSAATVAFEGDGAQCFAVGASAAPIVLYGIHHGNGGYDVETTSYDSFTATAVAWADVDGDGQRELAVGTDDGLHLFAYQRYGNGGALDPLWTSSETGPTRALAWGDLDGDGDPDLAVGNDGAPDRIYTDDAGTLSLAWSADGDAGTSDVAWGAWTGGPDPCAW